MSAFFCRTHFHPGNRVTVWKEQFYCIVCSKSLNNPACSGNSSTPSVKCNRSNGVLKHRLSFADQMSTAPSLMEGRQEHLHCSQPVTSSAVSKTNGGFPKVLKSSLRRSMAADEQKPNASININYSNNFLVSITPFLLLSATEAASLQSSMLSMKANDGHVE